MCLVVFNNVFDGAEKTHHAFQYLFLGLGKYHCIVCEILQPLHTESIADASGTVNPQDGDNPQNFILLEHH
jgi:hypothetical protein